MVPIFFIRKKEPNLRETNQTDFGNVHWLKKEEIDKLYPLIYAKKSHNHHGFIVNTNKEKNVWTHNIKNNTHCLIIGGTGSGKTQSLVLPTIYANAKSEIKPSLIVTDIKGELYKEQYWRLKQEGYTVKIFNLRNIKQSVTWNPLQAIYDQFKLMLKTANNQEKLHLKTLLQSNIKNLSKTLFFSKNEIDPFWNESGALIIEAIILGILEKTEIFINRHQLKSKKEIDRLLNKYLPVNHFNLASVTVMASQEEEMVKWFRSFSNTSVAKIIANQVLYQGSKTLASILMTMSARLAIFKDEYIRNLTCQNNLSFKDFILKPMTLFIVIPDENENYYIFASLLIEQIYKYLITEATKTNNKLIKPIYFLCDEFGNLPAINNIQNMITISRSRNIFFQLVVQDLQQLNAKYGIENANIIFSNCSLHIFLQTMDLWTAEKYSQIIGDNTMIQTSIVRKRYLKSYSETLVGHRLISSSQLMKLEENQGIALYSKKNPLKSNLVPWNKIVDEMKWQEISNQKLKLINFELDYFYDFNKWTHFLN